jgi:hypothetical protein
LSNQWNRLRKSFTVSVSRCIRCYWIAVRLLTAKFLGPGETRPETIPVGNVIVNLAFVNPQNENT